ncbi:protein-export chaperone SecB [Sessilibacter corallicola]|uniref:Protein-export protein SecB n=1 Tax=Sessilibacter corallicola TaxID=2904075 RepID=A0ABQ0A5S3_9GAMM|nr:protein-export chaperone SecB [Sessilibacter corallicola]MCE2027788.1 protein-export chaperone SecB [Sessilibacter corallicola]
MAEEHAAGQAASEGSEQKVQFAIQRIYIKDLSFEAPMGAQAFRKQWKPAINQELNTKTTKIDENLYEVILTLTVTVKIEEETAFLVEVQQGGAFTVAGLEGQQLAHALNTACPQILFPYAREAIDGVVTKGSFPALMLPPVNFDALFAQAVAQAQQNAEAKGQEDPAVN